MKTLEDLIGFLKEIPEEEWTGGQFETVTGGVTKRCVAGHINHKLTGDAYPQRFPWRDNEAASLFLKSLGVSRDSLVTANNLACRQGNSSKTSVLDYLQKHKEAA